ncbi:MAG TPA: ATP-binding protein [Chloroflexota bacterium]|nr:ATP-binding protein [Chloroflexota bacterium]
MSVDASHTALPRSQAEALNLTTPWLLTDLSGVIRELNPAAAELLGGIPVFLLGKPFLVFFSSESFAPLLRHLVAARRTDQQWTMRLLPWRRPPVAVRLTAGPVWSDRRGLAALAWTLEPLPAARATPAPQLGREAGPQEDAEALRRVFLSAMSHELLTPLAIIQGQAETLRYPALRAEQAQVDRVLDAIKDEAARLQRLVQNVIDTARASAGELEVAPAPASLAPLVARAVQRFTARSRRHRFVSEVPSALPAVLADLDRLESVLYNLLDNALKYSPRGGTVAVRAVARAEEVEVSVEDEGVGIPPGEEAHVFAPYYRAAPHSDVRAQGSGLGLYLCKAVLDAHGGRIWIEPRPERGAAVRFTLPLA